MNYLFKRKKLCYVFFLIPFFKPYGLTEYQLANQVFQVLKMISIFFIALNIGVNIVKGKIRVFNRGIGGLIFFWGIYLTNCILKGNSCFDIINNSA